MSVFSEKAVIGTDVTEAARRLNAGEVVAVPTETVYGLAGNALNREAVLQIFKIKRRPSFDPLIVHCADAEEAFRYAVRVPPAAFMLAEKFWPGPLTLVLPSRGVVPEVVNAGLPTVALRVPAHPLFIQLLQQVDFPLAAPSANPFGYVSPTQASHVFEQLGDKIGYILDGGPCQLGLESTIVGFEKNKPVLLRLGAIPTVQLQQLFPDIAFKIQASSNPSAPGQLTSHYAPRKKVLWCKDFNESSEADPSTAYLVFGSMKPTQAPSSNILNLSEGGNYHEAARNLYHLLRQFDTGPWRRLKVFPLPEDDEGLAHTINDRLRRATASFS